jgi:hypothetical protein
MDAARKWVEEANGIPLIPTMEGARAYCMKQARRLLEKRALYHRLMNARQDSIDAQRVFVKWGMC